MGLNESYAHARSQVLMQIPVPSVNQAYAMIISVESQRTHGVGNTSSSVEGLSETTLMSNRMPLSSQSGNGGYYNNSNGASSEQEEECLAFIIMDIEIRNMEMEELVTLQENHNSTVNFVTIKVLILENESSNDTTSGHDVSMFTQEQYHEILQMLRKGKSKEVDTMTNVATAGLSGTSDTGASNHMVHNFSLMSQSTNPDAQGGMKVNLPTGDQVSISHVGESLVLKDKLDLFNGRVLGIGKENQGLYILNTDVTTKLSNGQVSSGECAKEVACKRTRPISFNSTVDSISSLWHKRLGHAPLKVLSRIKELNIVPIHDNSCSICPIAKQSRLPFPTCRAPFSQKTDFVHDLTTLLGF
ncbi:uncharacterized protein [Solanum lycopersicum]|uniref:uncharacterized protein n=1 Tax=Solanum lycopersicum TaxID=4081 RepID=UPI00374A8D88